MVKLREIPRTAAFAWSPGASKPLIVSGTRAGAVDADFSDETKLELWDLSLDNQEQGLELQPIASIVADSRFYDIAWGPGTDEHPKGIIAGALESGSLNLWDAEKLLSGSSDALIASTKKHTGAVKALQFNPLRPQILASAGAKGELYIYDVNDPSEAFRLGTAAAHDLDCVAWNTKVSHILATGGSGGFVTIWDLKTKKTTLTLNNNRKPVSSIAWDPNNSTKLLTATHDDMTPVILLWDLRNSNAPERTLQGHEQGVLSVSWCQQDGDILLSCGKDNKTLVWNPQTGQKEGELPEVTNWTFLTRFHPHNPNLSATASFDGKITIQTLQNTNPAAPQSTVQSNLDGEDFFTQAQTQPQGATFSLPKPPKWFERPIGASFGFGGKLIIFKQQPGPAGQKGTSKVEISQFSVDSDIGAATDRFEGSLKNGDLAAICEEHKELAKTGDEKADWLVMENLLAENPRKRIVEYLGFSKETQEAANGVSKDAAAEIKSSEDTTASAPAETLSADSAETQKFEKGHRKNRLSQFFSQGPSGEGDDFLANLSATKGAKTEKPFHLFADSDTTVEKQITKAIMLGQFEKATDICLKEERLADAFVIANCGGKELMDRVQAAYLSQKVGMPSYLRLLGSVIVKNLWDVVYNADLADWKETMAALCTFADPSEFPDLCEALGDRILEAGTRKNASFCYLVGSKLEKVVGIWIEELQEAEQAGLAEANDTTFSIHARTLQNFMEKVTIFRQVAKFQDAESSLTSDWKLAALYDKYTEYADIMAAHGQLSVAQKYLDLLPASYPAAEVARNRLKLATQKKATQPVVNTRTTSRVPPTQAYGAPSQPAAPASSYMSPAAQNTPSNLYGPPNPAGTNPYAPAGYQPAAAPQPTNFGAPAPSPATGYGVPQQNFGAPPQQGYQPYGAPTQNFGGPPPPSNFGAPPRNGTPSASKGLKEMGNWNDVPLVNKAPPPRRNTPLASGMLNQPGVVMPPPASPYGAPQKSTPPPPPKGPAPGRVVSPLGGPPQPGSLPPPPRPGSAAANAYAPPPSTQGPPGAAPGLSAPPPMAGIVPRTASPYNAAPAGGPPTNRYAPAPAAPGSQQPPQQPGMAPPPGNRPPPAANPYAPAPQANPYQSQPTQMPYGAPTPQQGPPPTGPPPSSLGGPPPAARSPAPPPPKAAPPAKARHPAGDRTHIPANAQRLVEVFERDFQRVAAKAPASFQAQVKDTLKRLNLLFDHLNNDELVKPDTINELNQLAEALEAKNYPEAQRIQVDIQTNKTDEGGNWIVGIKRLISMSKATP